MGKNSTFIFRIFIKRPALTAQSVQKSSRLTLMRAQNVSQNAGKRVNIKNKKTNKLLHAKMKVREGLVHHCKF